MFQYKVEPKKNNNWWKWLIGIIIAIAVIYIIVEISGFNDMVNTDNVEPQAILTLIF